MENGWYWVRETGASDLTIARLSDSPLGFQVWEAWGISGWMDRATFEPHFEVVGRAPQPSKPLEGGIPCA